MDETKRDGPGQEGPYGAKFTTEGLLFLQRIVVHGSETGRQGPGVEVQITRPN
jgi:hypothetical protein